VATDDRRQFVALERLAVDVDRRIAGLEHALPHRRELIVAVDEDGFHVSAPRSVARPAPARALRHRGSRSLPRTRTSAPDGPTASAVADRAATSAAASDRDRR